MTKSLSIIGSRPVILYSSPDEDPTKEGRIVTTELTYVENPDDVDRRGVLVKEEIEG